MVDWHMKGGSDYEDDDNPKMWFFVDIDGFVSTSYDSITFSDIENDDPYMYFSNEGSLASPDERVEIGLYNGNYLKFESTDITLPSFSPSTDYSIATKKYVDDNSGSSTDYIKTFSSKHKVYYDVATLYEGAFISEGIKITLPILPTARTFVIIELEGWEYKESIEQYGRRWKMLISGFRYEGDAGWYDGASYGYDYQIIGQPFFTKTVRFSQDDDSSPTELYILIGEDTDNSNSTPVILTLSRVEIYSTSDLDDWSTGWTIESESDFTTGYSHQKTFSNITERHIASTFFGDLDLRDNEIDSDDGDTRHDFGRGSFGYCGHSDYLAVGHRDVFSTTNYCLLHSSTGSTYLNCGSSQVINFRENNNTIMNMNSSGLQVGSGARITSIIDDDSMATASATTGATSESIKAYVDNQIGGFSNIETGYYTGDGSTDKDITLGYRPKFLVIYRHYTENNNAESTWIAIDEGGIPHLSENNEAYMRDRLTIYASGFNVDDDGGNENPNASGVRYDYVAFY